MNRIGCCKSICPHLPQAQSKVEIEEGTFSAVRAYEARSSKAAPEGSGPTGNAAEVWVWGLGGFGVSKKCTWLPAKPSNPIAPCAEQAPYEALHGQCACQEYEVEDPAERFENQVLCGIQCPVRSPVLDSFRVPVPSLHSKQVHDPARHADQEPRCRV